MSLITHKLKVVVFIITVFHFGDLLCELEYNSSDQANYILIAKTVSVNNSDDAVDESSTKILRIASSPFLTPLLNKFADSFRGTISFKKLDSEFNNESDGIEKLCYKANDISVLIITRQLNNYERSFCMSNAQTDLQEIKIGHIGFVIISNKQNTMVELSSKAIYKALSDSFGDINGIVTNNNKKWNNISKNFQDNTIGFYGPISDTASYNFLISQTIFTPCISDKYLKAKIDNKSELESLCKKVRRDGVYVGDTNDGRLTISKLFNDKMSYGVVNYWIYQQNKKTIKLISVDGTVPTLKNIYNESYGLTFPLYVYIKKDKMKTVELVQRFYKDITDKNVIGEKSFLKEFGFIPLGLKEDD